MMTSHAGCCTWCPALPVLSAAHPHPSLGGPTNHAQPSKGLQSSKRTCTGTRPMPCCRQKRLSQRGVRMTMRPLAAGYTSVRNQYLWRARAEQDRTEWGRSEPW